MATTKAKAKPRAKKATSAPAKAVTTAKKPVATAKVIASVEPTATKKPSLAKKIFGRKYDNKAENILTIFKSPKIIGAVLAELFGSMILAGVLLATGAFGSYFDAMLVGIVVLGLSLGLFAISGANINPIVTLGLMATRRMSPIRGVLYLIAQIFGAWLGLLIISAFAGHDANVGATMPAMAELTTGTAEAVGTFWPLTFLEFMGALIIGFFFVRALVYKRSTFTFAVLVAAGSYIALTFGLYFTAGFLGIQGHAYIMNPAAAIMYQILPSAGADFGDLMGKIGLSLSTYVLAPAIGAIIGSYLSDTTAALGDAAIAE